MHEQKDFLQNLIDCNECIVKLLTKSDIKHIHTPNVFRLSFFWLCGWASAQVTSFQETVPAKALACIDHLLLRSSRANLVAISLATHGVSFAAKLQPCHMSHQLSAWHGTERIEDSPGTEEHAAKIQGLLSKPKGTHSSLYNSFTLTSSSLPTLRRGTDFCVGDSLIV